MPPLSPCRLLAAAGLALLAGCGDLSDNPALPRPEIAAPVLAKADTPNKPGNGPILPSEEETQAPLAAEILRGKQLGVRPTHLRGGASDIDGDIDLNFEDTDVRDVAKTIFGDILHLDYEIDSQVQGTVTVRSTRPLPKKDVLPAVEAALKLAGVAIVAKGRGYLLVPAADAARRSTLSIGGTSLPPGFHVVLVPLNYVSAAEIKRAVEPVVAPGTILRIDPARNLVVLAGTEEELADLIATIEMFDVDWLQSQSFGLFPMQAAPAKAVAHDLAAIIGTDSPMSGVVRIETIDRLNAVLVVSPRASYLDEIREWIERLDREGGKTTTSRIFVYRAENARATDLAKALGRLLGGQGGSTSDQAPSTDASANTGPAQIGSPPGASVNSGQSDDSGSGRGVGGGQLAALAGVKITADDTNNALLIFATPAQYAVVQGALAQLDTIPLQVLLEAVIAEVTLTNDLQYGVQSYFQSSKAQGLLATTGNSSLALTPGGFSVLFKNNSVTALLELLAQVTTVQVISSPEVMVVNNHAASLQVGDDVPIATSSAVSTVTSTASIVNTIQMESTGVILKVTPRVNPGGLVLMDVSQDVSASVNTTTSSIDSPTIQQRRIATTVAVQDGQTIALGGLISDNRSRSKTGFPWLMDLPVVGPLFGVTADNTTRTELLVLITPHVVRDRHSAERVTEELRDKLSTLHVFDPKRVP